MTNHYDDSHLFKEEEGQNFLGNVENEDDESDDDIIQVNCGVMKNNLIKSADEQKEEHVTETVVTETSDEPHPQPVEEGAEDKTENDLCSIREEDKPWKKVGADISDYFNFGFGEKEWLEYCDKQRKMRMEVARMTNPQVNLNVDKSANRQHGLPIPLINTINSLSQQAQQVPFGLMTPLQMLGAQTQLGGMQYFTHPTGYAVYQPGEFNQAFNSQTNGSKQQTFREREYRQRAYDVGNFPPERMDDHNEPEVSPRNNRDHSWDKSKRSHVTRERKGIQRESIVSPRCANGYSGQARHNPRYERRFDEHESDDSPGHNNRYSGQTSRHRLPYERRDDYSDSPRHSNGQNSRRNLLPKREEECGRHLYGDEVKGEYLQRNNPRKRQRDRSSSPRHKSQRYDQLTVK